MKKAVIHLPSAGPISSAALVERPPRLQASANRPSPPPPNRQIQQALAALQKAAAQLQESAVRLFASHREQLIRLSLEIAAKILAKDIQEQNYQIEAILQKALEGIGSNLPITIRLHPQDLQTLQQAGENGIDRLPSSIRWIPDPTLKPAECILQTEEEMIEWIIDEHLKRISDALLAGVQTHDENGSTTSLD
jgi:flagellar biosynthesis/type III secretory pathway protein FliH